MEFYFTTSQIRKLLDNKYVVIIGDSVMRSVYKDLVLSLTSDRELHLSELKQKGEKSFLGDNMVEGGIQTNGIEYREIREYCTSRILIRFYFITRCFNPYVETILTDLHWHEKPDVVILNSCLWDINRYGPNAMKKYVPNLNKLFISLSMILNDEYANIANEKKNATICTINSKCKNNSNNSNNSNNNNKGNGKTVMCQETKQLLNKCNGFHDNNNLKSAINVTNNMITAKNEKNLQLTKSLNIHSNNDNNNNNNNNNCNSKINNINNINVNNNNDNKSININNNGIITNNNNTLIQVKLNEDTNVKMRIDINNDNSSIRPHSQFENTAKHKSNDEINCHNNNGDVINYTDREKYTVETKIPTSNGDKDGGQNSLGILVKTNPNPIDGSLSTGSGNVGKDKKQNVVSNALFDRTNLMNDNEDKIVEFNADKKKVIKSAGDNIANVDATKCNNASVITNVSIAVSTNNESRMITTNDCIMTTKAVTSGVRINNITTTTLTSRISTVMNINKTANVNGTTMTTSANKFATNKLNLTSNNISTISTSIHTTTTTTTSTTTAISNRIQPLVIWLTTFPISAKPRGGLFVDGPDNIRDSLRFDVMQANYQSHQLARKYNFNVLDMHYHFRNNLELRAGDGIHWLGEGHLRARHLIINHICKSWGVKVPQKCIKNCFKDDVDLNRFYLSNKKCSDAILGDYRNNLSFGDDNVGKNTSTDKNMITFVDVNLVRITKARAKDSNVTYAGKGRSVSGHVNQVQKLLVELADLTNERHVQLVKNFNNNMTSHKRGGATNDLLHRGRGGGDNGNERRKRDVGVPGKWGNNCNSAKYHPYGDVHYGANNCGDGKEYHQDNNFDCFGNDSQGYRNLGNSDTKSYDSGRNLKSIYDSVRMLLNAHSNDKQVRCDYNYYNRSETSSRYNCDDRNNGSRYRSGSGSGRYGEDYRKRQCSAHLGANYSRYKPY